MRRYLILLLIVSGCGRLALGGLFFHRPEGTPPPGRPRDFEQGPRRAGHPEVLSTHAGPSNTEEYAGYYVGGGSAHGGDPRRLEEGTWGWDYEGIHFPRHVRLGWSHGRRDQGGTGAYRTDGHPIPNVFAFPPHPQGP